MHKNNANITGTVYFTEKKNGVHIKYDIYGLSDGRNGFHIHNLGDLTDGCNSACAHYNPLHKKHGVYENRHAGKRIACGVIGICG